LTRTNTLIAVAVLGLSIGLVNNVVAQGGVVGRVVGSSGQPLPGVSVTMLPASGGLPIYATTGADGTYRFEKVPDGRYRVDFELRRFDITRRNWVQVRNGVSAFADATLRASGICECVMISSLPPVRTRSGRVVDGEGRPLPRARLELVAPLPNEPGGPITWSEVRYADAEGRFAVSVPLNTAWKLTVSDSGFRPVTQQVSGGESDPLVFRLTFTGGDGVFSLPEYERLEQSCRCSDDLFKHAER
jgi:hypothetical protein